MDNFFDTRLLIYLKADRLTNNKSNSLYQEKIFETLMAADAHHVKLDGIAELNKIRSSASYINFKKKAPAER